MLNTQAVALAADSAVTFGSGKIRNSADKIFHLSKWQPVGIMMYNNAALWRLPWETVVKYFRSKIGRQQKPELETYADAFIDFIKNDPLLRSTVDDANRVPTQLKMFFVALRDEFEKHLKHVLSEREISNETELREVFDHFLLEQMASLKKSAVIRRTQPAVISPDMLQEVIEAGFPKFPLNDHLKSKLHEVAVAAVTSLPYGAPTGLVFAGYGTNDLVPSLVEYLVAGFADGYLHVQKQREVQVAETDSCVIPFAQSDVVATFMNGVAPDYLQTVMTTVRTIIANYPKILLDRVSSSVQLAPDQRKAIERDLRGVGRALNKRMRTVIEQFQEEEFSGPVLEMVAGSSKSELASIAESLVFLTSLRRQFSTDEESVGGPIDVAVISRGDGFVWIKRKHYFGAEINPQFIRTYFEDSDHA